MRAIILAAGRGSRMKSLTDQIPKCLVKLRGKSLLEHQLDAIRGAGIQDIAIVTGYRRELLTSFGLTEYHNLRWSETNMVYSLMTAGEWLEHHPCVVSYSDIFYESSAVSALIETTNPLSIAFDPKWLDQWSKRFANPLDDAETFVLGSDNRICEIGKRPKMVEEIQGQFMGLISFTPFGWVTFQNFLSNLRSSCIDQIDMTGILQRVIDSEVLPVIGVPYHGTWGEIDSQSDLSIFM